jgi:hypothetical protein
MFSKPWIVKIWLIFLLLPGACGDSQSARTNSQPQQESLQGHISIWKELPIGLSKTERDNFAAFIHSEKVDKEGTWTRKKNAEQSKPMRI